MVLGRFISRDPIVCVDAAGLYEYVGGRPTELLDPSGEHARDDPYHVCLMSCYMIGINLPSPDDIAWIHLCPILCLVVFCEFEEKEEEEPEWRTCKGTLVRPTAGTLDEEHGVRPPYTTRKPPERPDGWRTMCVWQCEGKRDFYGRTPEEKESGTARWVQWGFCRRGERRAKGDLRHVKSGSPWCISCDRTKEIRYYGTE